MAKPPVRDAASVDPAAPDAAVESIDAGLDVPADAEPIDALDDAVAIDAE